jgi:hypothetical protein
MKHSFFLFFTTIILVFSCNKKTAESTVVTDSVEAAENDRYFEMADSSVFHIGDHVFELTTISKADFEALPDLFKNMDTSETNRMRAYASVVSRKGDSLGITCANNKIIYMINNNDEDDDAFANYTFLKDMPEINQWLLMGTYYEAYGYLLIDKTSGDSTALYGMPVVSPDKKYIITFNQDLQANFTFNGFQLFEMKQSKPVLIGEKELYTWGPDQVKWKGANTLLIQQAQSNFTDPEQDLSTTYAEMKMK